MNLTRFRSIAIIFLGIGNLSSIEIGQFGGTILFHPQRMSCICGQNCFNPLRIMPRAMYFTSARGCSFVGFTSTVLDFTVVD